MASEKILPVQLYGTSSLCFDKDDFMKDDFSVDAFVRVQQAAGGSGLEVLRDHLGVYLKILRSAMIELINRDYADFVNLSTNLTGLDRLIEALKTPLGQLREEVLSVERLLSEAIATTSRDLEQRNKLTQQKALLHRLSPDCQQTRAPGGTAEGRKGYVGGGLVDRLAAEVDHLNFLVSHCEGAALLDVFRPRVAEVCRLVEGGLERGLREGVLNRDLSLLQQTLRTHASLGSTAHAHRLVRTLIRKEVQEVISEGALRSNPRGLPGLYANTLAVINSVCQPLLTLTTGRRPDVVRGYSFLECSAWPEVVSALHTNVNGIFNPGNPAVFHKRYLETLDFLDSFEALLGSRAKVAAFREMDDYNNFMQLWNLPVYFQIRYQEIGQAVEASLIHNGDGLTPCTSALPSGLAPTPASTRFHLASTCTVWEAVVRCFSTEVFLLPLLHRFWKLTLLVLARYRTWVVATTARLKDPTLSPQPQRKLEGLPGSRPSGSRPQDAPSSLEKASHSRSSSLDKNFTTTNTTTTTSTTSTTSSSASSREAAVGLVRDVVLLSSQLLPDLYTNTILPVVPHLPQDKLALLRGPQRHHHRQPGHCRCCPLRQVADTPRLYRRTNRAPPSSHQPYIASAAAILTSFAEECRGKVDEALVVHWLTRAAGQVSQRYRGLTYEVLSSAHKMEESLKRLKRARDRGSGGAEGATAGLSDHDKIRTQICLDVEYFGEQLRGLSVDVHGVDSFSALLTMVQQARDGSFVP
ncbi:LOW QUALITY PROTEIN: conserved oligomeric Golgi complex subunit 2-like [Scylla paramamosain]|uniref:LOW QUALITY PROTEIN: conserved oligomeric Golgi complex subunit 2-like n=1 Tax=Scylla paramamosain TaxID=85552 RepID=UPI003082F8CA